MYTVHGTGKLLTRLKQKPVPVVEAPTTTVLGNWYANTVPWRPQAAILVNEATLLPVFIALAPAKTLLDRFGEQLAAVLGRLHVPGQFIDAELAEMAESRWAKTASRSVVGSMNDFVFLAGHHRANNGGEAPDLVELSVRLASTPCSPLYKSHSSPDLELAALIKTSGHAPKHQRRGLWCWTCR